MFINLFFIFVVWLIIKKTLKAVILFHDFFHLFDVTHVIVFVEESSDDCSKLLIKVGGCIILNISDETDRLFSLCDDAVQISSKLLD